MLWYAVFTSMSHAPSAGDEADKGEEEEEVLA